jgi:hypothetical protein
MENLSLPSAGTASFRTVPRFGAGTAARFAADVPRDLDLPLAAENRLFERNSDLRLEILPRDRSVPPTPGRRPEAEKIVEKVPEARENVVDPGESVEPASLEPGVTILVVDLPPLGIPQDLVRLRCLLEPLLGLVVFRV